MKATMGTITIWAITGRGKKRAMHGRDVSAFILPHLCYHRTQSESGDGWGWTITHRDSGLAVRTGCRTRDAARRLAIYLEANVMTWPTRRDDGQWVDTQAVAAALRAYTAAHMLGDVA